MWNFEFQWSMAKLWQHNEDRTQYKWTSVYSAHSVCLTSNSVVFILSRVSDRMREYCTLSSLCLPEQLMHMRMPRFTESHSGSGAPQSTQRLLPGRLRILEIINCKQKHSNIQSDCLSTNVANVLPPKNYPLNSKGAVPTLTSCRVSLPGVCWL